jgi:hypothetical protein
MASAKDMRLRPIERAAADECVRRWHYSGRTYSKSRLHIGAFLNGELWGAIQLGPGIDTRKLLHVVPGTPWNGYLEINRMAFGPGLPRNSESRALAITLRMLRRHAPHIQWVVSYADATQCGDGAIYRAAGMLLTQVRTNSTLYRTPDGDVVSDVGIATSPALRARLGLGHTDRRNAVVGRRAMAEAGLVRLHGYQIRYIAFLDADARRRLASDVLSYDAIPADARMSRGVRTHACSLLEGDKDPPCRGVRPDQHAPVATQTRCVPLTWGEACQRLPTWDRDPTLATAAPVEPSRQIALPLGGR